MGETFGHGLQYGRVEKAWIALGDVDDRYRGWYFDSYGLKPFVPEHINRIRKNCKSLRWNVLQLQSHESTACGHFCVMYLHFLSFGLGFDKFLQCFSSNLQKNDDIVRDFVSPPQNTFFTMCDENFVFLRYTGVNQNNQPLAAGCKRCVL